MVRARVVRVRLPYYRSIGSRDIQLGALTFLVGPNGSGKSNCLDALRLVTDALRTSVDQALRERGGLNEVRRRSTGHPHNIGVTPDLRFEGHTASYGVETGACGVADSRLSGSSARSSRSNPRPRPARSMRRAGRSPRPSSVAPSRSSRSERVVVSPSSGGSAWPESVRGAKERVAGARAGGVYRETVHQATLSAVVPLDEARRCGWVRRLDRDLRGVLGG